MNITYLQTDLERETTNFKAFDLLTTALTRIDKYQSSKDEKLLDEAAEFINEALKADDKYFKAKYFQAVVNHLQGNNKEAIDVFYGLESNPTSEVGQEIRYNIAVANYNIVVADTSKSRSFEDAIHRFKEVADTAIDPETKLLARAGLALSYAKQNEYLGKFERQEEIEVNGREIKTQHEKIQKTLASTQERLISDEVGKKVNLIMEQALNEDVKLPRRRRRKFWRRLRRHRVILAILGAAFILWMLILYQYFYFGVKNP
jgi:tetratricopeptide (TPR) repeat protein